MAESAAMVKKLLALNIKALRKKRGFSQEKLAEATGLAAQSISDIEGCRSWVSDRTLEKLALALNVDIFLLFVPQGDGGENTLETFLCGQLAELRAALKKDIDGRLDRFYTQGISRQPEPPS